MNLLRIAVILLGGWVAFSGYNGTPLVPDIGGGTNVVILPEEFPQAPSEAIQALLLPLDVVVTDPTHALVFARAHRDWALYMGRDEYITDLSTFVKVRNQSLQGLLNNTDVEGKYKGQINTVMESLYRSLLQNLKGPDGKVISTNVTPEVRASLVTYFDALSWKFYEIYKRQIGG